MSKARPRSVRAPDRTQWGRDDIGRASLLRFSNKKPFLFESSQQPRNRILARRCSISSIYRIQPRHCSPKFRDIGGRKRKISVALEIQEHGVSVRLAYK